MRIGFLISPVAVASSHASGVRQQALIWKRGLESLGHEVRMVSAWSEEGIRGCDVLHIFQYGQWLNDINARFAKLGAKAVFSPIIDTVQPALLYRMAAACSSKWLRMHSPAASARRFAKLCRFTLARSQGEKRILRRGLGIPDERVATVKIGLRFSVEEVVPTIARERLCVHVSSYYQPRKNVVRLIEACRRIRMPLLLVGSAGSPNECRPIRAAIGGDSLVQEVGFVGDSELKAILRRARVFALPSICEGVGLAALEAAALGCEIVITRNGGARDYLGARAFYVDPLSTESIANGLSRACEGLNQPNLAYEIGIELGAERLARQLEKLYNTTLVA